MKKYLIGLLSVFLIIGGVFFTACGKEVPTLTLSHESIEIELVQDDDDSGYQIVTAEVSGVKNPTIQANSVGGYENIIEEVKVQKTSSGKAQILIKGKTEGYGEVVVSTAHGFISKIIKVNVFSYVSFMEQKENDLVKSNQYVIKGQDNILNERSLLHFEPSENSRREITWSLATQTPGAQITGNVLTLSNNFSGDENGEISLIAKTERGIEATVTLPVLDKIEGDVRLKWSYSPNSSFEDISEEYNDFLIVPNYPTDDQYEGYVLLDYEGDLQVEKIVLDSEGNETDDIQIVSQNPFEGKPLFKVYANKDKKNLNGDYTIYFNIGYENYDYSITSKDKLPLNIKVREKINKITVSTNNEMSIDGTTQTIYTEYARNMGKEYFVNLEPTSVVDGTYKYAIEVEFTEAIITPICDDKPLEFWYKDAKNGNIWTQIQMVETENGYKTVEGNLPSFNNIYIKAASSLNVQTFEGLKVTFISDDNNEVKTSFNAKLVKSVSQRDFVFDDTTFKVDSSETSGEKIIKKRFTLVGQNSVEGIRVVNLSENVTLSQPTYVSDDQDSVTFDIVLTLKSNRYGITSLDHYRIEHENGLKSEDFDIDIFLPLKDVAIRYDNANDKSNSVTYYENSANVYDGEGQVKQASQSLDNIMLKNNSSTIVLYAFNTSNKRSAEAQINVEYYDYADFRNAYIHEIGEDDESVILQAFIALRDNAEGVMQILTNRKQTSQIATFTSNNKAITTKGIGFTYAVVKFTGKSAEEDLNGFITLNRIVLIESYIAPDGLEVRPNSDSQVTLYANDTVASRDEEETRKHISVNFANSDVTYNDFSNLIFESTIVDANRNPVMGDQTIGQNSIVWEDGRYAISNINIDGNGISFDIEAITTKGEYSFSDELHLHYVLKNYAGIKVQDIYVRINITIKNAQRVEKLVWENSKDDELYFRVGQSTPYYMVLSTYPSNSKNINLMCLVTNENGQEISNFVNINDNISSTTLEVTLSNFINEKMKGYVYILPEDAIYGGQIKYYYKDNEIERENTISLSVLGSKKDANETWYEYLVENAYFKSNANLSHQATNIAFADILVKAKITVVDGKSFDSAYRVFSTEDFEEIYTNKTAYYTIMNSLDLTELNPTIITDIVFEGGIQGANENVALKANKSLFDTVGQGAEVRNITILGEIINSGAGFVAKTNNGTITNVTIDTNGMYSSVLSSTGENAEEYIGGLVGINNGSIIDSNVLGLTIIDEDCTVGGLTGLNNGTIQSSRVEFYNLKEEEGYGVNTFTGKYVGAIAGQNRNASISHSYAYTYVDSQVLFGSEEVGAIAGQSESSTIDYSFAYLYDITELVGDNQGGNTFTDYYISYMEDDIYKVNYVAEYETNPNFVREGQDGYLSYVNNGNAHLKDLYQDKKIENITGEIQNCTENGYYKSLNAGEGKGILFFYQVKNTARDLTNDEQKDLDAFNRIDLQQLLGQEISRNINISSSNSNIVNIIGKEIYVLKTGKITLSIYSKQDTEMAKNIEISVENAVSEVIVSWINNEVTYYIVDGATTYLQTTKSRDYFVEYKIKSLILGNFANRYEIAENDRIFDFSANNETENPVLIEKISNNIFKATVSANNEQTLVNVRFNGEDAFSQALNNEFAKKFTIIPTEGVIEFSLSEDNVAITPSTNATIRTRIQTTAQNDTIYPVIISENGETLERRQDGNIIKYALNGKDIIDVQVFSVSEEEAGLSKILTFDVNFAVTNSFRVSEDLTFEVYFASISGNESKDGQNGTFELVVTKQNFTNIDVTNFKIASSRYETVDGKVETVYSTKEQISTLAPGGYGSVLRINVNPEFAYYDYMELSYSGASVVNALYIEKLRKLDGTENEYVQDSQGIEIVANAIRYTPTSDDNGRVYFKLWVNTNVNNDSVFKITAKYYNSNETDPITYVNYYLSVSYLKEPTVEVDGDKIAYVAYGSTADVTITVLKDQTIDDIGIIGEDYTGFSLLSALEETIDEEKGIKIYKTKLSVSLLASAKNNVVYVQAQVSRMINGSKEIKTAQATVYLVDFKIDDEKITIEGANDNNLTVWVNVPKAINVNYNLVPEKYTYDASDEENVAKVTELEGKRQEFLNNGYYPANINQNNNYYINYKFDEYKHLQVQTLKDRLYYVEDNKDVKIDDSSARAVTAIIDENGNVSLKGNIVGATARLKLKTYVIVSGEEKLIETIFNIKVSAYSDPDIPLLISDAMSFKQLSPEYGSSSSTEIEQNDYILENDIVLEDYTAFSTDRIRSFDGNGHIIYIKNFMFDESKSTLKLALFDEIKKGTTIKNVRVNIYNAGQLTIDKSTFKNTNIAGFAIKNAGVIYNSEVIAFYNENCQAVGDIKDVWTSAGYYHSNPAGINVKFVNGKNTDEEVYLTDNANWQVQIAGFVLENEGSITNSRVGGEDIVLIKEDVYVGENKSGFTKAETQILPLFNIKGQGNIAGFALSNSGYIASSYVKNADIENKTNSTSFFVAGFVGNNTKSIITSYIEGAKIPAGEETTSFDSYTREGSSIKSTMGYIAGFVYDNNGNVKDSYSNILISNSQDYTKVYLASGFVYKNRGELENCYSASQIRNSVFSQMNFSGVDAQGNLLTDGIYTNCYFFNKDFASSEDNVDYSTETQYNTGARSISNPREKENFYGFAVANGETDGTWQIDEDTVTIIEANVIALSNRYTLYVEDETNIAKVGENEKGKYVLPYSTLNLDEVQNIDTSLGGKRNPIIIANEDDFATVFGNSESTYIANYYNEKLIFGSYRIVNDIDLSKLTTAGNAVILPSNTKAFAGTLQGNGFTISGISITSNQTGIAYGLFASFEKYKDFTPTVTNTNFQIEQVGAGSVAMVGGVAGYIKDAIIVNVEVEFKNNGSVSGLNFAGGIAGFITGRNIIKNIVVINPTVVALQNNATRIEESEMERFINASKDLNSSSDMNSALVNQIKTMSYAGSVFGVANNYKNESARYKDSDLMTYDINNVKTNGHVYVKGGVVGGVIGFIGPQTNIRDIGIKIAGTTASNNSKIIATKYYAGGIVGQSYGALNRVFATYEDSIQNSIENNLSKFYSGTTSVERGAIDIFYDSEGDFTQEAIGGLIGYTESGKIEISYSKINVTSPTADYAGGIIGITNVSDANTYQIDSTATKYLINEVYATGDVRGKVFAGGIIGKIQGENSRVALKAVNALNAIANYDYQTNQYIQISEQQTNVSSTLKVNSIVGHFVDDNGDIDEITILNIEDYLKYINFIQVKDAEIISEPGQDEQTSQERESSVAYYKNYTFSNKAVTLNIFGEIDGNIETCSLYQDDLVFAIESPLMYTSSTIGHTYTQAGFLNSGVWDTANWNHALDDLFPTIKYTIFANVIYLDNYNIEETFAKINENKNAIVIVRGYKNKSVKECTNVDLRGLDVSLKDFSGTLLGSAQYTVGGKQVKIIADKSFIESVAPGFTAKNLIIEYKAQQNSENISINRGLFVEGEIEEGNITNLSLIFDRTRVLASQQSSEIENYGLITPVLRSTSINGLSIEYTGNDSGTLFDITPSGDFNAGLIAGTASQTSELKVMQIKGVSLKIGNAISISGDSHSISNANIGTYFGQATRIQQEEHNAPERLKITIGSLKNTIQGQESKLVVTPSITGTLNIGGIIGYAKGLSYLNIAEEGQTSNIETSFEFINNNEIVNAGGTIGYIESNSSLDFVFNQTTLTNTISLPHGRTIETLNAGAVFGQTKGSTSISIRDFGKINFAIGEAENKIKVTTANIGGIVGDSTSALSIDDKNQISDNIVIADNYFIDSQTANIGGVIGRLSVQAKTTLTIKNALSMNAEIDGINANIGGAIANIGYSSEVAINSFRYLTGKVVSNATGLVNFGGAIATNMANTLSIKDTIFGGEFRVQKSANICAGGILASNDTTSTLAITNCKTYGDVFVDYGTGFDSLQNYYYGGIVGYSETGMFTISNNETLMTSHNIKYALYAHALFGDGFDGIDASTNEYNPLYTLTTDDNGTVDYEIKINLTKTQEKGHKLNPATSFEENTTEFNSLTFYKLANYDELLNQNTLENVAIIGDGTISEYNFNSLDNTKKSLIDTLKGHSFVSGLIVNVDRTFDSTGVDTYAGLVKEMQENSIVFASQVKGNMSIGGGQRFNISGLVGTLTSGKIADSSTDIDIIYRGAPNSSISSLTNTENSPLIENCYTAGSVTSYVNAYLYNFSKGGSVQNSYSITKLDGRDYLSSSAFAGSTNYLSSNYGGLSAAWVKDENYNYGYPTLKYYDFLKTSSWATRGLLSSANRTGYDACVEEYAYTRAANNTTPTGTKFYLIPDLKTFKDVIKTDEVKTEQYNMVLLYDIDASSYDQNVNFTKELDGNGHTISGLEKELFNKLSGATIRNLRLTDAASEGSILTTEIENGTIISNLTLSGTSKKSPLAYESNAATIQAVTNMTVVKSTQSVAGGLIGNATNTTIRYCSNYGNIYLANNSAPVNMGGLVGQLNSGSIDYSYNVGAVVAGTYSNSSPNGNYYVVGGLAGYAKGPITNSYNSGIIKAGNKANGDNKAYAGGIVGYSTSSVDTCFNEGSVEALGKNPETKYEIYTTTSYEGGIYRQVPNVSLVQKSSSSRNVWAYGIGFVNGDVSNVYEEHIGNTDYIFANGTAQVPGTLKTWYWSEIKGSGDGSNGKMYLKGDTISANYSFRLHWNQNTWVDSQTKWYTFSNILTYGLSVDQSAGDVSVDSKSVDKLGLDRRFTINIGYKISYIMDVYGSLLSGGKPDSDYYSDVITGKTQTITLDWDNSFNDYLTKANYFTSNKGEGYSTPIDKSSLRSKESSIVIKTTTVNGKDHYIADTNNCQSIFSGGIYKKTLDIDISDLPYFEDISLYSIESATLGDQDIKENITINSISEQGNSVKANITITAGKVMSGTLDVTVKCNYDKTIELGKTDNLKFVYVDDNSIGIDASGLEITNDCIVGNYSLEKDEETYERIVKTYFKNEDEEHDYSSDTPIYFAYQDNLLIYIPNATLKKTGEADTIVNKTIALGTNFATAINTFKEKEMVIAKYMGIETKSNTTAVSIDGIFDNKALTITNNDTITQNFTYGKTVNPTIGVTSTEEKIINNYLHATEYVQGTTYYSDTQGTIASNVNASNFSDYYTVAGTKATSFDGSTTYYTKNEAGDYIKANVDATNFSNFYIVDTITYSHATSFDANTTYYVENDGVYTEATGVDASNFSEYYIKTISYVHADTYSTDIDYYKLVGAEYVLEDISQVDSTNYTDYYVQQVNYAKATAFDATENYYTYDSVNDVYTSASVTADTFSIYYLQNITYVKATSYDVTETYYTENSGVYTEATGVNETNFSNFYTVASSKPTAYDSSAVYYTYESGTYSIATVSADTFSIYYIEDTATTETKRTHTVSITGINEDTIALSGNSAAFGYQNGFTIPNSFSIDGVTYDATLNGANIILTSQTLRNNDTPNMTNEQNAAIEGYFDGLSYIQNQDIDTSGVLTIKAGSIVDGGVTISYTKDITWGTFAPTTPKISYTYDNITIYYGNNEFTANSTSEDIAINSIRLVNYNGSYVQIDDSQNEILEEFIETNDKTFNMTNISYNSLISFNLVSHPFVIFPQNKDELQLDFDNLYGYKEAEEWEVTQQNYSNYYVYSNGFAPADTYSTDIEYYKLENDEYILVENSEVTELNYTNYYIYYEEFVPATQYSSEAIYYKTAKVNLNISRNENGEVSGENEYYKVINQNNDCYIVIKDNSINKNSNNNILIDYYEEEIWNYENSIILPEYPSDNDLIVYNQEKNNKLKYTITPSVSTYIKEENSSVIIKNILRYNDTVNLNIYPTENNSQDTYTKTNVALAKETEANSIVLMKDISLGVDISSDKSTGVNIIGNGYFIKYANKDKGFYNKINANSGDFIKDASFLGELQSGNMLTNTTAHLTLSNLSFYGSIASFDSKNNPIAFSFGGITVVGDIKSYINIKATSTNSISLYKITTNYGAILAKDGADGVNGGLYYTINGENGGKIEDIPTANEGYVLEGLGGNGGAGADAFTTITSKYTYVSTATSGGTGGIGRTNGLSGKEGTTRWVGTIGKLGIPETIDGWKEGSSTRNAYLNSLTDAEKTLLISHIWNGKTIEAAQKSDIQYVFKYFTYKSSAQEYHIMTFAGCTKGASFGDCRTFIASPRRVNKYTDDPRGKTDNQTPTMLRNVFGGL